jgi:cell division protein FtsQ
MNRMLPFKKVWIYLFAPLFTFILIGASKAYQSNKECNQVNVNVEYKGENFFLDVYSVRKLIHADEMILGARLGDIRLSRIEEVLMQTNYVKKVNASFDGSGALNISLWLKNPIARVVSNEGQSFYINEENQKIPTSETFTARTILVRGDFKENLQIQDTLQDSTLIRHLPLIRFIANDPFWSAYSSELVIGSKGVILYPSIGDLKIELGIVNGDDFQPKFKVLEQFFTEVLQKTGWQKYHTLKLNYKNQLVAVRR